VRVVERRVEPRRPSRALIVHPRTMEVLRPLGVTAALLARGGASPTVHLHLGARVVPVRLGRFHLPDTPFPYLTFVRQAVVEDVLAEALATRGVEVERGVELVGLYDGDAGTLATVLRGGSTVGVECQYVAGCDGAEST